MAQITMEQLHTLAGLAGSMAAEPELGFGGPADAESAVAFARCARALDALLAEENLEAVADLLDMLAEPSGAMA